MEDERIEDKRKRWSDYRIHREVERIFKQANYKIGGLTGRSDADLNGSWANVVKEYERE